MPGESRTGALYASCAFVFWGLTPIYYKLLPGVAPVEVLAHRVVWSVVFGAVFVGLSRNWSAVRAAAGSRSALHALCLTAALVSANWLIYIYAIVNDVVQSNALAGTRPAYVRDLSQVRTLAPIPRPRMIMNTAVNFYSHIAEGAAPEERARQIAARKANRGVPYMFLKAPSSVIGTGETILIPYGRTELDWEIEIATVIGRTARYVAAPKALDHVFGYTVMLDISDRGGRPPGGFTARAPGKWRRPSHHWRPCSRWCPTCSRPVAMPISFFSSATDGRKRGTPRYSVTLAASIVSVKSPPDTTTLRAIFRQTDRISRSRLRTPASRV